MKKNSWFYTGFAYAILVPPRNYIPPGFHIPFFSLLFLAGFTHAQAQDSLYWECDSTSREYRSRFEADHRMEPVYDPALECGPIQEMERKINDGVVERFQYCLQSGLKIRNGTFESRYRSGRVKEKGVYSFDRKTGEWETWYPGGQRESESRYVNGKLDGVRTEYRVNGKVMDEFKYHEGRIDCSDGYHRSYYRTGRLKVDFGIKDGRLIRYVLYDGGGKVLPLPSILKAE